jgi:tetratricopeptide (TPR) repeat protein
MRDLLAHSDLSRYARQFVWLELSYDEPRNTAFLTKYGATATPTFFVIDPRDETVAAMQSGAMSLAELKQFLDRGIAVAHANRQTPANEALRRGDMLTAQQPAEAAKAYQQALELAPTGWEQRELAQASLVQALQDAKQWQNCAESAGHFASAMKRDVLFVRTVAAGMWCLALADADLWVERQLKSLQPLSEEALLLPITVRDHRDSIYRTLMYIGVALKDQPAALKLGDRWLEELDAIKPRSDDERSALDIARVENVQIAGDPVRILTALRESEKAMPTNYIASLRLAQMELAAKQYSEASAACDRGLGRGPGAVGRSWLLRIKAQALQAAGRRTEARNTLKDALRAAEQIPSGEAREKNITTITKMLGSSE